MSDIGSWIRVFFKLVWYLVYRTGLVRRPDFEPSRLDILAVFVCMFGWRRRLRVLGGERCPGDVPCVYAANHSTVIDPFMMFAAIQWSCGVLVGFMSRDDFFASMQGTLLARIVDFDELMEMCGTHRISRGNITLGQLKPFIKLLREGKSFIMYPNRTRSRSGIVFEYRDEVQEPGSVAFFLAQARRSAEEREVAAVPVTRTYNPATKVNTIAFGEPMRLEVGAGRERQREFDFRLVEEIARNVVVNAGHVVSGIIYLRCLHGMSGAISVAEFERAVERVLGGVGGRLTDRIEQKDLGKELRRTLGYLEKAGMLTRRGEAFEPIVEKVLSTPELDSSFRKKNPVKYYVNQILHYPDVVSALEEIVLGSVATAGAGSARGR